MSETMVLRHRGKRGIRFLRVSADGHTVTPTIDTPGDSSRGMPETPGNEQNWTPLSEAPASALPDVLEDAYRRGVADGRAAAQEEFSRVQLREEETAARSTEALTRSIHGQFTALFTRIETDALRFALAIAERIVKREVRLDKEVVVRQIREAVKRIVGTDSIKLRVHPDDESVARRHRTAILSSLESVREVIIEADASIDRGGCIIESTSGNVDARLDTQLRQVDAALFGTSAQEGRRKR